MRTGLPYVLGFLCLVTTHVVTAIDCYVCSSVNNENERCEDPFEKTIRTELFIKRNCYFGFFKATHCIKLKGTREDGSQLLVRQCSDDDWGSHCGDIKYEIGENYVETVYGCLETCDYDGCNSSNWNAANYSLTCVLTMGIYIIMKWIT